MEQVFSDVCTGLGLNVTQVDRLLVESRSRPALKPRDQPTRPLPVGLWSLFDADGGLQDDLDEDDELWSDEDGEGDAEYEDSLPLTRSRPRRRAPSLIECPRPLHTDPDRLVLNRRFYISTDGRLNDPALAPFLHTFPCAVTINDFSTLPRLRQLAKVRSASEKIRLGDFFMPLLEVVMAARGAHVYGTPGACALDSTRLTVSGSTFSAYAAGMLHESLYATNTRR